MIFALPTVLHEDERYYAKGEGPLLKRATYSSTRVFITPNYQGKNTVNASELWDERLHRELGQLTTQARTDLQVRSLRNGDT